MRGDSVLVRLAVVGLLASCASPPTAQPPAPQAPQMQSPQSGVASPWPREESRRVSECRFEVWFERRGTALDASAMDTVRLAASIALQSGVVAVITSPPGPEPKSVWDERARAITTILRAHGAPLPRAQVNPDIADLSYPPGLVTLSVCDAQRNAEGGWRQEPPDVERMIEVRSLDTIIGIPLVNADVRLWNDLPMPGQRSYSLFTLDRLPGQDSFIEARRTCAAIHPRQEAENPACRRLIQGSFAPPGSAFVDRTSPGERTERVAGIAIRITGPRTARIVVRERGRFAGLVECSAPREHTGALDWSIPLPQGTQCRVYQAPIAPGVEAGFTFYPNRLDEIPTIVHQTTETLRSFPRRPADPRS